MNDQFETEQVAKIHIKRVIEALLFAAHTPLSLKKIEEIIETIYPLSQEAIKELITLLQQEYQKERRAFQIEEREEGFLLRSSAEFTPYIGQLFGKKKGGKTLYTSG